MAANGVEEVVVQTAKGVVPSVDLMGYAMDPVGLIGGILSAIGLLVGFYTLWKVQKVAIAQQEERRITQELLDVDQIEMDIRRVITKLSDLNDSESMSLTNDMSRRLGAIQGTRKAMGQNCRIISDGSPVTIESGFFSNNHVNQLIEKSTSHIDIMTGSTRLISSYFTLDLLRKACERGVHVRIIGIDPEAPDDILLDAARTVSHPAPTTPDEYRQMMNDNNLVITGSVAKWKKDNAKTRFEYRAHPGVPRVSIARSDDVISLGFLQLFRDAQPSEIDDRQYIQIRRGVPLGDVISKHFDLGWAEGRQILPEKARSQPEKPTDLLDQKAG